LVDYRTAACFVILTVSKQDDDQRNTKPYLKKGASEWYCVGWLDGKERQPILSVETE